MFKESSSYEVKVAFVTLGCAKNEVDTREMSQRLVTAGFHVVGNKDDANVIIVNTCSFIQSATEESLEAILDIADDPSVEAGDKIIVVAGCMPARYGEDLEDELKEVSAFVPCSKEDDIVEVVSRCARKLNISKANAYDNDAISHDETCECSSEKPPYSYVKISDGCNKWCSYCTIPMIRGRYHSFPYEQIKADVQDEVSAGAREIVLIAQDTGIWGTDFEGDGTLAGLLASLAEEFPSTWFRVMYIQPDGITDELLDAMAAHENICSYLDIPLQHVDPLILHDMNRRGSGETFASLIDHIREKLPKVTLRTTLIAGFPGETDEMFQELEDFIQDVQFDYVGVFPYSREDGTRAAQLPNQIDEDEKHYRAQCVRDIADNISSMRMQEHIGEVVDVLIEGIEEDGQLYGRSAFQAPEVDGITFVDKGNIGEVVKVKITDTLLYDMEGEVL